MFEFATGALLFGIEWNVGLLRTSFLITLYRLILSPWLSDQIVTMTGYTIRLLCGTFGGEQFVLFLSSASNTAWYKYLSRCTSGLNYCVRRTWSAIYVRKFIELRPLAIAWSSRLTVSICCPIQIQFDLNGDGR